MKKTSMISWLVSVSILALPGCGTAKKEETTIDRKGTARMERTKTASGLEYEILEQGTGAMPQRGQKVTVHYTGWLDENGNKGTKFDSSVDRGEPFSFNIGVGQVIKGWDEGVLSMKIGEKRRLIIPANLGYGAYGAGRIIPPHAQLIFDVELINVG